MEFLGSPASRAASDGTSVGLSMHLRVGELEACEVVAILGRVRVVVVLRRVEASRAHASSGDAAKGRHGHGGKQLQRTHLRRVDPLRPRQLDARGLDEGDVAQ